MSVLAWIVVVVVVLGVAVLRVALIPYKPCRVCAGRGYCAFCGYRGKVLKLGARIVRPDLRRQK